jgi:hypothetical protein
MKIEVRVSSKVEIDGQNVEHSVSLAVEESAEVCDVWEAHQLLIDRAIETLKTNMFDEAK